MVETMFKQYFKKKDNILGHGLFAATILILIVFAFIANSPLQIFEGLIKIVTTNDNLLTDYITVANLGSAFINAALVTALAVGVVLAAKADVTGPVIAGVFTVTGFAFFGKDISNVIPIFIGVYLYSIYAKDAYKNNINAALFGTTMAPFISAIMLYPDLNRLLSIPLGIVSGLLLGFILPFVARLAYKIHNGYNLYNIGFSSGLILMIVVSLLRVFGFKIEPTLMWSSGNNLILSIFLITFFLVNVLFILISNVKPQLNFVKFNMEPGVAPSDFIDKYGFSSTLLNMLLIGLISHLFILLFNAPLNGPTIGGVFTIIGFGAYGKNVRNVLYILIGATLGHVLGWWQLTTPVIMLGALFGTGIAPIAGKYGFIVGVIAITLHIGLVQNVGSLYFGLNLYNNGFAEGFTGFIIPAIMAGLFVKKYGEKRSA
jgi:hypothetical protein